MGEGKKRRWGLEVIYGYGYEYGGRVYNCIGLRLRSGFKFLNNFFINVFKLDDD